MNIETRNPTTGALINTYKTMEYNTVDAIISEVSVAQKLWKKKTYSQRATFFNNLIELLNKNQDMYAEMITNEMGKPITASRNEIKKCALVCKYYAENAENFLADKKISTEMKKSYVTYQPLGIVFAIMPWNYPFWQVFRFAAPNLMAGNGCVLKHAPISTGASLAIETLFRQANFPENIFRSLIIDNEVAKKVIQNDLISGVTLTGSDRAGRAVASESGKNLKKVVLELGGSDPYLVLSDADLDLAVTEILKSRMNNSGQVCISAKRVILDEQIYNDFLEKLTEAIKDYEVGDPLDPKTKMGPLARQDLRDTVHEQVQQSIQEGGILLHGGKIPEGAGYFYPPTIIADVHPGMAAFDDEIFGPVIAICRAKDQAHAIQLANKSKFGLSAVVFTRDLNNGEHLAKDDIEVGTCFVNGLVSSDPRLPFGGIKGSGYGRELSSEGIYEFMNIKTVGIV